MHITACIIFHIICYLFSFLFVKFLGHLSRMLKWAFLSTICSLSVVVVVVVVIFVNFSHFPLLQNHWANFNQTWHKASLDEGVQICSNEGPCSFSRGYNYKMMKVNWRNLKIFFSRTPEPISTKLCTKHPWVKGIQDFTNKGSYFFSKER